MADPNVYLEKLSVFSRILRLEGLPVCPKETADAADILTHLGFEDRGQAKTALRTVFAKSREEQLAFDRVFDGFFVSEETMRQQAKEWQERETQIEQARQEAEQNLQVNGQSLGLSQSQLETYAAMPEEVRQKLLRFMEKYKSNAARNPELYGNFIHSVFAKTLLEQQMRMEDAALNCGIRRSELVGLNLTDVYEDRIRVVGKGNKERIVYFGSACRKALDAYLAERNKKILTDNRALFGSRNGNRISVEAVHRLVKKALLQAGLDSTQFSAHKLRHTAATMMLSGGVDVKTVQEVLGHENLNTTQIYTHIENTELKIAAEANPLSKLDFSDNDDE